MPKKIFAIVSMLLITACGYYNPLTDDIWKEQPYFSRIYNGKAAQLELCVREHYTSELEGFVISSAKKEGSNSSFMQVSAGGNNVILSEFKPTGKTKTMLLIRGKQTSIQFRDPIIAIPELTEKCSKGKI